MLDNISVTDMLKPELLVLIPVCWGMGLIFKSLAFVKNKYIPLFLASISIILSGLYIFSTNECDISPMLLIFTSITQGLGYWAVAWIAYEGFIRNGLKPNVINMNHDDIIIEEYTGVPEDELSEED